MISGVTLTKGNVVGNGGAIDSTESLTLINSVVSGNTSSGFGGGINFSGTNAKLAIINCQVLDDSAGDSGC